MARVSPELAREWYDLPTEGCTYKEIAEMYPEYKMDNISYHVPRIRKQVQGIPDEKVCPICKTRSSLKANFCPECGEALRSKEDIICDRIRELLTVVRHDLPSNQRDKAIQTLTTVLEIIGGKKEEKPPKLKVMTG